MLSWFFVGKVYQTIPNSLHFERTAAQTESLDLIKIINLTLNVNHPQSSETNKITKVSSSIPYSAQSQIHAAGRH